MDNPYPVLDFVFARASLLEAGTPPDLLGHPFAVSNPEPLHVLGNRRKGPRMARRLAPVVVHAALHDPDFPDHLPREPLAATERLLAQDAYRDWTEALTHAVIARERPMAAILKLPPATQQRLTATRKEWQRISERANKKLGDWIVAHAPAIEAFFERHRAGDAEVNIKRLSKFVPKAG